MPGPSSWPAALDTGIPTEAPGGVITSADINWLWSIAQTLEQGGEGLQSIAYAAAITPDATKGALVKVGVLTGNITINAPANPTTGRVLHFLLQQDVVGGRSVTWDPVFKVTGWAVNAAPNARTEARATYDGTNWIIAQNPPSLKTLGYFQLKVDYGAKFDGVTLDQTAWTNAIADAQALAPDSATSGGVVLASPGVSVINAQLAETVGGVTVQGQGSYTSYVKRANNINAHMFHLTSAVGARFLDMGFDLNGATNATTPHGIWIDGASNNVLVERCQFLNADGFACFVFAGPTARPNNIRYVDCDFVHVASGTHDLCEIVTSGGGVFGCRFTVANGAQIGLNVYESNSVVVRGNTCIGQGGNSKPLTISSCLGATVTGNTVIGGDADYCLYLIVEQDNSNTRNCVDTVIMGNTLLGTATTNSCGIRVDGGSKANSSVLHTIIMGNIIDTCVFAIYFNAGTVTSGRVAYNDLSGSNNAFGFGVTPTQYSYKGNKGYAPAAATPGVGTSPWTYSNVDGYDEAVMVQTVNTLTAITYKGQTGASILAGIPFVLNPLDTMIFTYSGAAPVIKVVPLQDGN